MPESNTNKVHSVRFYNLKCKAIFCKALQAEEQLLAVSRANASIEIWNLKKAVFLERTIPSVPSNSSIEGLVWVKHRLFSVGLHGFLMEYDLLALNIKQKWSVTGQSAFCIDYSPVNNQLAIGTEKGYVNLFSLDSDEVVFDKFLDKQEGRIICLKYSRDGENLVGGSQDAIRIWNVKSGHAIIKMTTGRVNDSTPTIVWCLAVMDDMTVISGDSRGLVTFWDGKIGGQIESHQTHKADVLTIALTEDQRKFYAAGVDPTIISYELINIKSDRTNWVKSIKRICHGHTVTSLVMVGKQLFSAGNDGYLVCSYFPPRTIISFPPVFHTNFLSIAREKRLILFRYHDYLEVWTLCEKAKVLQYDNQTDKPKKLLMLHRQAKNDQDVDVNEGIMTAALANNGEWIVYSTDSILRLLKLNYDPEANNPTLTAIDSVPSECKPCVNAIFTPDSSQLILASRERTLQVLNLSNSDPTITQTLTLIKHLDDIVSYLVISSCGEYLVIADPKSNIAVFKYVQKKWEFFNKLPQGRLPITAIKIRDDNMLFVIYSDHNMITYNLKEQSLVASKYYKSWTNTMNPVRNIAFDCEQKNAVVLHDDSHLVVVNNELDEIETKKQKIPKLSKQESSIRGKPLTTNKIINKYKHLVYFDALDKNEMIAVEVHSDFLKEDLPEAFKAKTSFGKR